jgi:hypothetical protein
MEFAFPPLSWFAPGLAGSVPDFLIISPPKTGSTWLAMNLRCHPDVFVPAVKEVKYFSSYYRWLDLKWYLQHFRPGEGRLKGEASPSYALLPPRMIGLIRALMPRVKLIFLMRDPVTRAWSHARHNYRYREANFRGYAGVLDAVADAEWRANFRHPWPLLAGDYLGQLRRWLAVFPREQLYIDCYERMRTDPVGLLRDVLAFLGARVDVDWSTFRTRETILPGLEKPLAEGLQDDLRRLLRPRTRELEAFLHQQFGLRVGEWWPHTLGSPGVNGEPARAARGDADTAFASELDDDALDSLLQTELESPELRLVEEGFHGYNLVFAHGQFLALPQALGTMDVARLEACLAGAQGALGILSSTSLEDLKERVMQQALHDLREGQQALRARQKELLAQLGECQAFLARVHNSRLLRLRRALKRWWLKWTGRPRNGA